MNSSTGTPGAASAARLAGVDQRQNRDALQERP